MQNIRYITDDYQERIDDASNLIYEISEELINTQISQNKNKSSIDNVIDTNLAILKKTEDTINHLFEEIESIKKSDKSSEELFKTIVD